MEKNDYGYFYGEQSQLFSFYRIPKKLITDENCRKLSLAAKFLYGILLDRMDLSSRNGWMDEQNRVYIIFTLEEINASLGCSKNTSVELLNELEKFGLIEKKKRGVGKPSIIYVKNFTGSQSQNLGTADPKKSTPPFPKIGNGQSQNLGTNDTDKNNTEKNYTESFPFLPKEPLLPEQLSSHQPPGKERKGSDISQRDKYRKLIKGNIGYDLLVTEDPASKYILDEIMDLMVDVVCTSASHIRVARDDKPSEAVKSQFLKLTPEHIRLVIESLRTNTTKVKNIRQYLTASLYNASMTLDNYYRCLVGHDMYGSS